MQPSDRSSSVVLPQPEDVVRRLAMPVVLALLAMGCHVVDVRQALVEVGGRSSVMQKTNVASEAVASLEKSGLRARLKRQFAGVSDAQFRGLSLGTSVVTTGSDETHVYVRCRFAYEGDAKEPALIVDACSKEVAATIDAKLKQ